VDDGSGPEFLRDVFARRAAFPNVQPAPHATNLAKAAALKTGINYRVVQLSGTGGNRHADADGQHHPDDIPAHRDTLAGAAGLPGLGSRAFDGAVPFRSRFGNSLTSMVVHALNRPEADGYADRLARHPTSLLSAHPANRIHRLRV